ncbi:hypothetical protein GCM10020331_080270 [Ectobacillus funiculus]
MVLRLLIHKKRIKYATISQIAIKRKMKMELIAEEMRVLYVALTRAKEKAYFNRNSEGCKCCTFKNGQRREITMLGYYLTI